MEQGWGFGALLWLLKPIAMGLVAASAWSYEFTPDRHSVPLSPSVELKASISDHVEFLYNRGRGAVSFRDTVLAMLEPEYLKSLKGFRSFKTTRLDLSVYEFRLLEILDPIETLLKKGIHLRFVADPSTYSVFKPLREGDFDSLSEAQKNAYIKSYDLDGDGEVTSQDAEQINERRFVSIQAFSQLRELQQKYPAQIELIEPPLEIVSGSDLLPFPRLHHLKDVSVDFYKEGVWKPQISLRSSANLTDSCMHHRIAQSHGNKQRYVNRDFASTNYAKGSQGNVQFGALIKGENILANIQEIKETWLNLYKKKKHFDEGSLRETILPRIVFEDPRGFRSTLETYYSEGTKAEGRKKIDPVLAAVHHLSGPDKTLRVHYSTQFVSTHTAKNHALRYLIDKAGDKMEDFFVLVDGNFATQSYSSLPHLAFAPSVALQFGTLEGKVIKDIPELPAKLDWQNTIGVYEGNQGVFGADADKMHAKVDYYEYVTRDGQRHYLVVWGSANSSKNSSKGNADVLHVLDSTDPYVGKSVRSYFKALKTDSRVFPFSQSYIDRKLRDAFNWDQRILNEDFIRDFERFLSGAKLRQKNLDYFIKQFSLAKTHSEFGENFLKILKWYSANVDKKLNWQSFYIILQVSNPGHQIPDSLISDLAKKWSVKKPAAKTALKRVISNLGKLESFGSVSKNVSRILQNCSLYLKRLGIRQSPSQLFSEVSQ